MSTSRFPAENRRRAQYRLVVTVGLAGFVTGVYVVVVLGGGMLIGRTDSPSPALSVLATVVVALMFAPVQGALERAGSRLAPGDTRAPYDVLSHFSESVTEGYLSEELPARMSMLLAQGTGAQWAQVWLVLSDRLTLEATWPADAHADPNPPSPLSDARDGAGEGLRSLTVRHGSELLGVLRLRERPGLPLTSVEERLFAGLAAQAGLVLRRVGLRTELQARHEELVARASELKASRERLIEAQDAERRRLERDLHDAAQQHLVALALNLRVAQTVAARSPDRAAAVLAEQAVAARAAIDTLSSLSRGIYPNLLARDGLVPALRGALATSATNINIEGEGVGRLPAPVEAALYFCCMEAVQNAAKHAEAATVTVRVSEEAGGWRLTVIDDGAGFAEAQDWASSSGAGLANMRDRLDAIGGTVTLESFSGRGTTVTATVANRDDLEVEQRHIPSPRQVR